MPRRTPSEKGWSNEYTFVAIILIFIIGLPIIILGYHFNLSNSELAIGGGVPLIFGIVLFIVSYFIGKQRSRVK
jgi:hypothetical protein